MKAASHRKLAFCVVVAIFILAKSARANAQISASVSDGDAREHLLKQIDPVYPAIAKAAQVQGQVVLQLEIDQSGQVAKVKALSGPPMLLEAAMDAVKQWRYKPFVKDGFAVNVTTTATIPFQLATSANASEMETANKFFPLSTKCHQAVSQRADPAEEVSACQEAAVQADRFSSDTRFIERRSAYVYYATALIRAKKPEEAVAVGEKAIAVVLQGHDDGSGSSAAYGVTGQAKAFSGDLAGADKDLETAEEFQRKALDSPAGHELAKEYSQTMKSLLSFHAQVLTAMGEQSRAEAKTQEAAKL
jgi:TonB family protein